MFCGNPSTAPSSAQGCGQDPPRTPPRRCDSATDGCGRPGQTGRGNSTATEETNVATSLLNI